MKLPESAFLIVIVRFGKYNETAAKDTRRMLMGIRTGGLPAYIKEKLGNVEFSPNLYSLIRSPVPRVRRATGGLAVYHYRAKNESVDLVLKHVREYLEKRIKKRSYLEWKSYDLLIARWL